MQRLAAQSVSHASPGPTDCPTWNELLLVEFEEQQAQHEGEPAMSFVSRWFGCQSRSRRQHWTTSGSEAVSMYQIFSDMFVFVHHILAVFVCLFW